MTPVITSKQRMILLTVAVFGHGLKHMFNAAFFVLLPEIKAGLNLSNTQIGTLSTFRAIISGFANIPAGVFYSSQTNDAVTFGVMASFVSSASVSDDIVYEVVRAVFENLDDFRKLHPAFKNLDPSQMISNGLSAPLHDGAVKYYKEQGWM